MNGPKKRLSDNNETNSNNLNPIADMQNELKRRILKDLQRFSIEV